MQTHRVKESNIGVYVAMSAGIPIDDDEGHILCIDSQEYDVTRISLLQDVARKMGYSDLSVEFIDSVRKISDEEYLIQQQRLEAGLVPDEYDIGEILDARKRLKNK